VGGGRRGALPQVILVLHVIALGLYAVGTALVLAPFAGLRAAPRALTLTIPLLGIGAHVVGLARLTPFVGVAPTLSMLALFLVLLQVASEGLFRASAVGVFTGPLATGLVGLALLIGLPRVIRRIPAPKGDDASEKSTNGHGGAIVGAAGGAGVGAAMGYSSAGLLCTIGGPLCLVVVVPAALIGGALGLAGGSVVDAVSAGPQPQAGPPPGDISVPQGG